MDKKAFYDLSYGLFILGVVKDGRPTGCTVNTVFQVTSDPPTLAICLNHQNYTNEILKQTGRLSVNLLDQEVPMDVIGGFGFRSGRDTDKFAGVAHHLTESGLPVLDGHICSYFECKVKTSLELSTHTLFIVEVADAVRPGGQVPPMTYAYYHTVKNGTLPKTAPHYVEEAPAPAPAAERWVCSICGYEYDGSQGPFADLPDGWKCPLCGAPKSVFEIGRAHV